MHIWFVIYKCINTLFYGNLVTGKHSCFCNILTNTFVNMCIYMYLYVFMLHVLYPVFIAIVISLIKTMNYILRDATHCPQETV